MSNQKNEFLNFAEISKTVSFSQLLDDLNIPYITKGNELHGDAFIVNIDKNLFFMPKNETVKGSVINFLAHHKKISLRDAAAELKRLYLSKPIEPKRAIPNLVLEWDDYIEKRGITPEVAHEYEIGLVKQRSVMAGRIAFKIYDHEGKHIGYTGYKVTDGSWFFPKGFKRPLYNAHKVKDAETIIVTVDPFDALRMVSLGLSGVASLLANAMTTVQEEQLKVFNKVLLLHKQPENITSRLYPHCFIKSPVLSKLLKEFTDDALLKLIKPSLLS